MLVLRRRVSAPMEEKVAQITERFRVALLTRRSSVDKDRVLSTFYKRL